MAREGGVGWCVGGEGATVGSGCGISVACRACFAGMHRLVRGDG